jgi:hypothetical protein
MHGAFWIFFVLSVSYVLHAALLAVGRVCAVYVCCWLLTSDSCMEAAALLACLDPPLLPRFHMHHHQSVMSLN